MNGLDYSLILYDLKVDQVLEIVKFLRAMGVSDQDFEFKYNPVKYNYEKGMPEIVIRRSVQFRFRQPEYLSYVSLKYSK